MTKMLEQQKILGQLQGSDYESQSAAQKAYNALVGEGMSHEQALQKMKLSGIDDAFAAQLKSASQADRMNALTERLADLFIGIAEPLMTVLDPLLVVLTEIVNLVSYVLAPAFKLIKDTVTGIQAIFSGNVESLNKMQMILGSIATVAGTFFAIFKGIKAVQTGILAVKTAYNAKQKQGIALTIRDAAIGFKDSATNIINKFKAYFEWPGLSFIHRENRIKIHEISIVNEESNGVAGSFNRIDSSGIYFNTSDLLVVITYLQFPNKNIISSLDAFNSYRSFFE